MGLPTSVSSRSGQSFEGLEAAGAVVCENNQYGMGTAVDRASAVSEIRQKAEGYGIPNMRVDGMNVMEVRRVALEVLEKVRQGTAPSSSKP